MKLGFTFKHLAGLITITLSSTCFSSSYGQYKNYIGSGATFHKDRLGVYLGVSSFGKVSDIVSVGTDLQLINEDIYYSINGTFGAQLFIPQSAISLFLGPRFGMILNYSLENDSFEPIRLGATGGVNYRIDPIEINARIYRELRNNWETISLGLSYNINSRQGN